MAFKYNGVTLINDAAELTNINSFDASTEAVLTTSLSPVTKSLTIYADSSARNSGTRLDGRLAYILDGLKLQVYDSDAGEYLTIATGSTGSAPEISGLADAYTITDGTPLIITVTAPDPDNDPLTFSVSTDSAFDAFASVSQNVNVFTLNVTDNSASANGTITFSVTDNINTPDSESRVVSFILTINYYNFIGSFDNIAFQDGDDITGTSGANSANGNYRQVAQNVYTTPGGVASFCANRGGDWIESKIDSTGALSTSTYNSAVNALSLYTVQGWDSANDYRKMSLSSYIRTGTAANGGSQLHHIDLSGSSISVQQYNDFPFEDIDDSLNNLNTQMINSGGPIWNSKYKFWTFNHYNNVYAFNYGSTTWDANPNNITLTPITVNGTITTVSFRSGFHWINDYTLIYTALGLGTVNLEIFKYDSSTSELSKSHIMNVDDTPNQPRLFDYIDGYFYFLCARNSLNQNRNAVWYLTPSQVTTGLEDSTIELSPTYTDLASNDDFRINTNNPQLGITSNGVISSGDYMNDDTTQRSMRAFVELKLINGVFNYNTKMLTDDELGWTDDGTYNNVTNCAFIAAGRYVRARYEQANQSTGHFSFDIYADSLG